MDPNQSVAVPVTLGMTSLPGNLVGGSMNLGASLATLAPMHPQHQQAIMARLAPSTANTTAVTMAAASVAVPVATASGVVNSGPGLSLGPAVAVGGGGGGMGGGGGAITKGSAASAANAAAETQILTKQRLQELVREVDPNEQLDEDVEEMLLQLADDFIESTVTAACLLAKHRKASSVEVKDVQLHLERNWNMWIPGFGTDELRPYKRATVTEAHKQRMALIRKALKKY